MKKFTGHDAKPQLGRVRQKNQKFLRGLKYRREIRYTWIGILLTCAALVLSLRKIGLVAVESYDSGGGMALVEILIFSVTVISFVYGNFVYQFVRKSYFSRLMRHRPARQEEMDYFYQGSAPSLCFLIPSYKEELSVIRQALLSCALQEYPNKRVVLLVDDPPHPSNLEDLQGLADARRAPQYVEGILEEASRSVAQFSSEFERRVQMEGFNGSSETLHLMRCVEYVAAWFKEQADNYRALDHTDDIFVEMTYTKPARKYEKLAKQLKVIQTGGQGYYSLTSFRTYYKKLSALFTVELTSFERKQYENLSHEPNKAMNLNSYIGLLGRSFIEVRKEGKVYLQEKGKSAGRLTIPDADYLITLDADSLLSHDYSIRLTHIMEHPSRQRLAVAQTPYSAIPNPASLLERIAGATTDMQYIIHQGFTEYGAAFWVGANALLRVSALRDICEEVKERGYCVKIFIQDRTVIEDTESSVDLVRKGWGLYNYPERLSYSATPPDFGSLLIQRCRWANGGLIILGKLLRYLLGGTPRFSKIAEGFMRIHYLISIAAVNLGLMIVLFYSFDERLYYPWLPFTAIAYYFFYGRDLILNGYNFRDLYRVYAFNLLLIPVNLAGVFMSVRQMISGQKIPFKRTPKIAGRTSSPASFLILEYLLLAGLLAMSVFNLMHGYFLNAFFGLTNAGFLGYALVYFIGFRESLIDLSDALVRTVPQFAMKNRRAIQSIPQKNNILMDSPVIPEKSRLA